VDCDPQANATTGIGVDKSDLAATLYHGLIGEASLASLIVDTELEALNVLPANVELIGFEVEMMPDPQRERALKTLLAEVDDRFDYIIIDCPPSLSLLTLNALTAADSLLIPLQCEFYALEGIGQLLQTYKRIKRSLNPDLDISGILLTMFDKRTNLSHQVAQDAGELFQRPGFRYGHSPQYPSGGGPQFRQTDSVVRCCLPRSQQLFLTGQRIDGAPSRLTNI
jgi:chromosome partitioning protein